MLSIVMPTIAGRGDEVTRTMMKFSILTPRHLSGRIEWLMEFDHPNVGSAWNAGAARAQGEYLLLGNDDLEPEGEEWLEGAKVVLDRGDVPLGWVREDAIGTFGRDFTRAPMCKTAWWKPLPEIHYYSDNAFHEIMRRDGHMPTVAPGYDFYHRRSMVGRDETPERVERDRRVFLSACF